MNKFVLFNYSLYKRGNPKNFLEDIMAKAKKSSIFPIIACAIILVMSILTLCMMAAPIFTAENMPEDAKISGFQYLEDMNEKTGDKTAIQSAKDSIKKAQEALDKAKDKGLPTTELQKALDSAKAPVVLYDSILSVIVISAIAMAISLAALVLEILKNKKLGFIFGLVAAVALLAAFIAACVATGVANKIGGDDVSTVAPVLSLVMALIGSLGGGVLLALKK